LAVLAATTDDTTHEEVAAMIANLNRKDSFEQ
jgi:hypothetical protein